MMTRTRPSRSIGIPDALWRTFAAMLLAGAGLQEGCSASGRGTDPLEMPEAAPAARASRVRETPPAPQDAQRPAPPPEATPKAVVPAAAPEKSAPKSPKAPPSAAPAPNTTVTAPSTAVTAPSTTQKPPAAKALPPAAAKRLPTRAKLPEAGEILAEALFPLVEKLTGKPVAPDGPKTSRTPVRITEMLAGQSLTVEELTILLAAHGIHLFSHERKDVPILVASRNPSWSPADDSPRFDRAFQVRARTFDKVREDVVAYLDQENLKLGLDQAPATLAADRRTGRLIVRAPTEAILDGVQAAITSGDATEASPEHLHTFQPSRHRASELQEKLLEALSDAEKQRVTIVIPWGKNFLLIRCADGLYPKIEGILLKLDGSVGMDR